MQVWTFTGKTDAVWTVTGQTDASMESYWIDRCCYGQLLDRLMKVWKVTGQTDVIMDSY